MKLTETKLKQLINEVIEEGNGAKGPSDLPDGVYVAASADLKEGGGALVVYYSNQDGEPISHKTDPTYPSGVVKFTPAQFARGLNMDCNDAMIITWSMTSGGFGPLLYDVAMEIATERHGGLAADRRSVSNDAYKVWQYYLKNRSGANSDIQTKIIANKNLQSFMPICSTYKAARLKQQTTREKNRL